MVFDNNTWLLKTRPNFSKLVCLTERRIWIYRDAVKSESCGVVHTVQLNYDLGGKIE